MWGQHEAPLDHRAGCRISPRMLNAAIRTARSFTGRLADGDVEVVGDGLAPLVARGYAHGSRAGYPLISPTRPAPLFFRLPARSPAGWGRTRAWMRAAVV